MRPKALTTTCLLLAASLAAAGPARASSPEASRAPEAPSVVATAAASAAAAPSGGTKGDARRDLALARQRSTTGLAIGAVLTGGGAATVGIGAVQWGANAQGEGGFDASTTQWIHVTGAGLTTAFVGIGLLVFGLDQRALAQKIEASVSARPALPADTAAVPAFAAGRPPRTVAPPAWALPALRF